MLPELVVHRVACRRHRASQLFPGAPVSLPDPPAREFLRPLLVAPVAGVALENRPPPVCPPPCKQEPYRADASPLPRSVLFPSHSSSHCVPPPHTPSLSR